MSDESLVLLCHPHVAGQSMSGALWAVGFGEWRPSLEVVGTGECSVPYLPATCVAAGLKSEPQEATALSPGHGLVPTCWRPSSEKSGSSSPICPLQPHPELVKVAWCHVV